MPTTLPLGTLLRRSSRIAGPVVSYLTCCLVLGICFAEVSFRPPRLPVTDRQLFQTKTARFGAELQDVTMTASDGIVLRGWFAQPSTHNGNAVILLHGLGQNRQQMIGYAELFLSQGYAVLLPDLRAHGTSGGDFTTFGVKEAEDVRQWFHWLATQWHPACVFGFGESMGAAIVLEAASTTPFCAVVAESPFASFRQFAYIRLGQMFHSGSWFGKIVLSPVVELAVVYGWLTRRVDLSRASAQNSVGRSRVPILLIHGLADDNIPLRQSKMILSHNPKNIVFWKVPKAGHCGAAETAPEEFTVRVLERFSARGALPSHQSSGSSLPFSKLNATCLNS